MTLLQDDFPLHDLSGFPLLRFRGERALPGYAPQWAREMEALLNHGQAFAVLFEQPRGEEDHEDRRLRAIWLKCNKERLMRHCRGLASVEPDAQRREALQAMSEGAARAFGVPQLVAASREEAEQGLRRWLASTA
ncbi:MAG: hypothetical protein GAK35_00141 [Herbaspirillum frisingense]|uniref:Uncharacterized protein n=1 Tax=Herbaspirillum frisingense TaxID=92645 RepID=A0A7V8JW05_9BURK|nr:MAG: hypothetical protein GAK35_00141 [Herbaspirillum frisingense]